MKDGKAYLTTRGMYEVLTGAGSVNIARFIDRNQNVLGHLGLSPVEFRTAQGRPAKGYSIEQFADVVDALEEAYVNGDLREDQEHQWPGHHRGYG